MTIREQPNVFLAGDWVGPEGMLADAAAASARSSAQPRARYPGAEPALRAGERAVHVAS